MRGRIKFSFHSAIFYNKVARLSLTMEYSDISSDSDGVSSGKFILYFIFYFIFYVEYVIE